MSRCENDELNFIRTMLNSMGLNADNIQVIRVPEMACSTAYNPNEGFKDMMYANLKAMGFSDERIGAIVAEAEENKRHREEEVRAAKQKREEEAAAEKKRQEALRDNAVALALTAIAGAYGYGIKACILNGEPKAEVYPIDTHGKRDTHNKYDAYYKIEFSKESGGFLPVFTENVVGEQITGFVIGAMRNARDVCKALNAIDWHTWPVVN